MQQDASGLAWVYSRGVWVHFCPCTQLLVWDGPVFQAPLFLLKEDKGCLGQLPSYSERGPPRALSTEAEETGGKSSAVVLPLPGDPAWS